MFKRPIVGIAICMAVGIFAGYATEIALKFAYIGCFVFAIASLGAWVLEKQVEKGVTFIFICLAAFSLGITLWQGERQSLLTQARALGVDLSENLTIRGTICAFPEERNVYAREPGGEEEDEIEAAAEANAISDKVPEASAKISNRMKKISFPLKIEEIKRKDSWQEMGGKILVNIYETEEKFRIGDRVEINGHLQPLPGSRNPGDFDYGVYLMRQGIVRQMSIRVRQIYSEAKNGGCLYFCILSRHNINFITRIAARGRDWMEKIIDLGPYDHGRDALLKAMLIGKREGLDEGMKQNFINTGTIHIIAISGLNMVIVMAIILGGCKLIFCPPRWANIICLITLILYAILSGGRASVWRATIMAALFLGGNLFNRQVDKWTSLSLAALIILFISPPALFDSGFQLTFMAVGGLMYFYPRLEGLIRIRWKSLFDKTPSRYILKSLLVVMVAQLALGPFLIYYYYRFPLTTFMANLLVVPALGLVTILGFVASLAGLVSFPLARAFNAANGLVLLIMDKVTSFLASRPGQIIYLAKPDPLLFVFYYLIIFLIFHPFKERSS